MRVLNHTRERLRRVLNAVQAVSESDFPYPEPKEALEALRVRLRSHEKTLVMLEGSTESDVVKQACASAIQDILRHFPLIGFILRSTNVRTAFEFHGPLLAVAQSALGIDKAIVLSSEWMYSPHVYSYAIPGYALIGVPACESDNPWLLPISGHELGHPFWRTWSERTALNNQVHASILREIEKDWAGHQAIFSAFAGVSFKDANGQLDFVPTYSEAVGWASRQLEESFCDFFGLYLFGESFLFASEYLLSPTWGRRSPHYPATEQRVAQLLEAAKAYGIDHDADYQHQYQASNELQDPTQRYLLKLADAGVSSLVPDLINLVRVELENRQLLVPDEADIVRALGYLRQLRPVEGAKALPEILAAGWRALRDETLWQEHKHIEAKTEVLQELIIKSVEVLHYESLTQGAAQS